MTLYEWNAKRKALARLEHTGWLNTRLNTLRNIAAYLQADTRAPRQILAKARLIARRALAYRRRHRFYDCLP